MTTIQGTDAEVITSFGGEKIFCNACQCYIDVNDKLEHYQSQWHRYNVKRKCAGMGPIPREIFESKIAQLQTQKEEKLAEDEAIYHCDLSRKKFKSKAQLDQWHQSKKYKALLKKSQASPAPSPTTSRPSVKKSVPSDDPQPIPINECLFDGRVFANYKENLNYMVQKYNFFIPYIEYLPSVPDLLTFCGFKVGMGRTCLYCGQRFSSLQALRQHMVSKNHCKLNLDEDGEDFDELYDWSAPQLADGEIDVDCSDEDHMDDDHQQVVVQEAKRTLADINDAGELVMTDGTVLGHRDLSRYYKQRPRPLEDQQSIVANMMAQYRRLQLPGYRPGKEAHSERTKHVRMRQDKWQLRKGTNQNKLSTKYNQVKFIHG